MKYPATPFRHGAQGIATLIVSIFLVLLSAIVVFAVSRVMLTEHRMSSNEIRYRQAHEAASAGLDFAVAYLSTPGGADKRNNVNIDTQIPDGIADKFPLTTLSTNSKFRVAYCNPRDPLTNVICPDTPDDDFSCDVGTTPVSWINTPRIVACGWSDDNLGRVRIVQGVGTVGGPGPGSMPRNPLTTKGAVNVNGSATVTNFYTDTTIWTGELKSIGNAGKTFIRNQNIAVPSIDTPPPPPPTSCASPGDYTCGYQGGMTTTDVIVNPHDFDGVNLFTSLFGYETIDQYIEAKRVTPIDGTNSAEVNALANVRGEIIVVRGPLSQNMNFNIGSRENPVVLIVDGDWSGGGNTEINGLVYVSGRIDLQGNKKIYGSTVVEGSVQGSGSLDLIYDPFITDNDDGGIKNIGRRGVVPSSWRDW